MKYRPEIDGLRALAVVPVILFHAGFELFSGGFVGVDVFFVISGYLITTIIIEDIETNRFSLLNFYERRVRRIFPVLFFVMLACIPFAWMWMLSDQMKSFSQSLIAASLFAANILFWRESGYFSASAQEKPLLHTWSLAVEEQYYLLFPIFLSLAWRFGKSRVFWVIVVMALVSLLLSEIGWRNQPIANFYFAPTRAWEILSGSIAAFIVQKRGVQRNDALSLFGLTAITFAIFTYDEKVPFPSVYTLVPVLGVVLLVLFADKETIAAKLLSTKALVGMGLISYSAYLWHQPIFAFARIFYGQVPPGVFPILCIVVIFLSYFSWRFIEKPFRKKKSASSLKVLMSSTFLASTFIIFGISGYFLQGFSARITYAESNESLKAIAAVWDFRDYPPHRLIYEAKNGYMSVGETKHNNLSTIFIGDSHAYQYWHAIANYVDENRDELKAINVFFKLAPLNKISVESLNLPSNTKLIVFSYFWALKLNNPSVNTYIRCCGNGPGGVVGQKFVQVSNLELDEKYSQFEELLKKLKSDGIRVVLVLDNPFGEELNPKSLVRIIRGLGSSVVSSEKYSIELSTEIALDRREPTASRLKQLARKHRIEVIDPFDYLCDSFYCLKFSSKGYLRYKDYDHLSLSAVENEGRYIHQIFSEYVSLGTEK